MSRPSLPSLDPSAGGLSVTTLVGASSAATYVVVCGRTRAAAVIDPRPDNRPGIARAIEGCKLRYELYTSTDEGRARTRLRALSSGIGLAPPSTGSRREVETGCLRVVPTAERSQGHYVVTVNGHPVHVGFGQSGLAYTVRGEPNATEIRTDRLRLAFGAWHIDVFALFWSDGVTLAYSAGGHVWFGGMLRSPQRAEDAGERILPLDRVPWALDDLLHPSLVRDGLCIGTLRQEQLILAETQAVRLSGTYLDQELDRMSGVDGLLTPIPDELEREFRPARTTRPRMPDSVPPGP